MNIVLGAIAAMVTLAFCVFVTVSLGKWWLSFTMDGAGGVAAWMAGALAVLVPMFFGSFVLAGAAFFTVSGIHP